MPTDQCPGSLVEKEIEAVNVISPYPTCDPDTISGFDSLTWGVMTAPITILDPIEVSTSSGSYRVYYGQLAHICGRW